MDSIYFEDPLGLLIELASYRFEPPHGFTHADVLLEAHRLRVERGDYNIAEEHLADAIERLVARSRESLSDDRSPKDPYRPQTAGGPHGREHPQHPQAERQQPVRRGSSSAPPGSTSRRSTSGAAGDRRVLAKDPARLTPLLECDGLPRGSLWESCAIMQYLCNKHGLDAASIRPTRASGRWSTARCSTFGDAVPARRARDLSGLGFGAVRGRGRRRRGRDDEMKAQAAQGRGGRARRAARGLPRVLPRRAGRSSAATSRRSPTSGWRRRSSS